MRIVEAFHAFRYFVQAKERCEPRHCTARAFPLPRFQCALFFYCLYAVALRHHHLVQTLAALRADDRYGTPALLTQPGSKRRMVFRHIQHDNFPGNFHIFRVKLLQKRTCNFPCGFAARSHAVMRRANDIIPAHEQRMNHGILPIPHQRKHIPVRVSGSHGPLFFRKVFYGLNAVAVLRGLFKFHPFGSIQHLPGKHVDHRLVLAFKKAANILKQRMVFLARNLA